MKTAFVVLLILALAACAPTQQSGGGAAPNADTQSAAGSIPRSPSTTGNASARDASAVLPRYHWQLLSATDKSGERIDSLFANPDKPLQIDFNDNGLFVSNTCNNMHGGYALNDGKLEIDNLASTLMACPDPKLMAMDTAVGKYLDGSLAFVLATGDEQPAIQLTTAQGDKLVFVGQPTAETRYGSPGETVFLEVAPKAKPCTKPGAPDAQCLDVRALHYDAHGIRSGQPGPWHVLDLDIEGYSHEPGVRNVLRVKRFKVAPAPANGTSVAYVLDMVVESELLPPQK